MKRMKLLFTLAIPVILCQNAQAQTESRLTAQAHWYHDGAIFKQMDSTAFVYSGNVRGGDLTHTQKYDNSTSWTYLGDTAYMNNMYYTQEFDANNNISSTTNQMWNGMSWVLTTRTLFTYNSLSNMTTRIEQTWGGTSWVPVSKTTFSYDASNLLQLEQYMTWDGLTLAFVPNSQKVYTYDVVTKKLINETDQDVSTGTPVYTAQYNYTYSSLNQLLTTTYSTWGLGWVNSTMETNAYDTAGNKITRLMQNWDVPTSAWVNVTYDIYSNFTTTHKPQSHITQTWNTVGSGSWVNTMQFTYTYNSYDQKSMSIGQSWNVVGIFEYAHGDPKHNYYYELYSNINAVNNVVNTNGTAHIYPVPASNMLHIELKWDAAQASTVAIYDMTGRIVTPVVSLPSAVEYHTALPVNTLAPGMYVIKINGAEGQVVKQIIVGK